MTIPRQRKDAVMQTRDFLVALCNPKQTPRVPSDIRRQARSLLRHYPSELYMDMAAEQAPRVFGDTLI
jgi:hypothetical protein